MVIMTIIIMTMMMGIINSERSRPLPPTHLFMIMITIIMIMIIMIMIMLMIIMIMLMTSKMTSMLLIMVTRVMMGSVERSYELLRGAFYQNAV